MYVLFTDTCSFNDRNREASTHESKHVHQLQVHRQLSRQLFRRRQELVTRREGVVQKFPSR
jgi:hypothetical protein